LAVGSGKVLPPVQEKDQEGEDDAGWSLKNAVSGAGQYVGRAGRGLGTRPNGQC
jgi:hypothetical protein